MDSTASTANTVQKSGWRANRRTASDNGNSSSGTSATRCRSGDPPAACHECAADGTARTTSMTAANAAITGCRRTNGTTPASAMKYHGLYDRSPYERSNTKPRRPHGIRATDNANGPPSVVYNDVGMKLPVM